MKWSKNVYGGNTQDAIAGIALLLLLISFYHNTYWLTLLGSILLIFSRLSKYYLDHVADGLTFFNNEKKTIRLAIDEETDLSFEFSQNSFLPIYHATLIVKLDPIVEGIGIPADIHQQTLSFKLPFQLRGKESTKLSIPVKGLVRGASRIRSIELMVPNFFGFGFVEVKYILFIHKEILVYPNTVVVPQLEKLAATNLQGEFPTLRSMFDQPLAPIGTRDYVFTDSFKQVHWKASAKTQSLQTKVYEKTAHYSWTIILNLRDINTPNYHIGMVETLEEIIKNGAFLVQYATKKGIEFELFINLSTVNLGTVYHLPIGQGTQQLGKALDTLSRIHRSGSTLPTSKFLRFVEKREHNSPVVIACGRYGEEDYGLFMQMKKRKQRIYFLHEDSEIPAIVPFS